MQNKLSVLLNKIYALSALSLIIFILLLIQGFTDALRETKEDQDVFKGHVSDYFGTADKLTAFPEESLELNIIDRNNVCISSDYNTSRIFNGIPARHEAIDLAGPDENYNIKAAHSGIIKIETFPAGICSTDNGKSYISYNSYTRVTIQSSAYKTLYIHMKEIYKNSGIVAKGELIGKMGNEGCSTGKHLHFELYAREKNGYIKRNPEDIYTNYKKC